MELWLISGGDFEGVFMQRRNCACDPGAIASRRPALCGCMGHWFTLLYRLGAHESGARTLY